MWIQRAGIIGAFVVGFSITTAAIQIVTYKIDAANTVCWDQPHTSLSAANAMKTRVKYDAAAPVDVGLVCTGSASPFLCKLAQPVPLTVQTVGQHQIVVEASNLDIDGTYTPYVSVIDFLVSFSHGVGTPQRGSNGKIVKGGS